MAKQQKAADDYYEKVKETIETTTEGDIEAALDIAGDILKQHPERSEGYFALGLIAYHQGDSGRAIELVGNAHEIDPDCREYADALAVMYTQKSKLSDGLYFAKLATALDPNPHFKNLLPAELTNYFQALAVTTPSVHYVKAMSAYNLRLFEDAAEECERELRINEDHIDACRLLAKTCLELGTYDRAEQAAKAAVALDPKSPESLGTLGNVLTHLGEFGDAVEAHRAALNKDKESVDAAIAAMADARFLHGELTEAQAEFRAEVGRRIGDLPHERDETLVRPKAESREKINIGYLSDSLFDSVEGIRIQTLLGFHNRNRFNIHVYQVSIVEDSVTIDVSSRATTSRQVYDLDDDVFAMILENDEIDVLVDLCGYSRGHRLGVVSEKVAPVQIGYMRYPFGFEAPGINYVLSDPVTEQADAEALGKDQRSIVLDYGLFAVLPYSAMQDVKQAPAADNGYVTFGGHCDLAYLTPPTADVWAEVLKSIPDSKLLLGNMAVIPDAVRERAGALFAARGVGDRIEYFESERHGSIREDFYHRIDIMLDTFPVSGELRLCEALWLGVPAISLAGEPRTSLMGKSILVSAGKPNWACDTGQQFVEVAGTLAADLSGLGRLREDLREEVGNSVLFNPRFLATTLEDAYVEALEQVRGKPG